MPKTKNSLSNNLSSVLEQTFSGFWPRATKNQLLAAQLNCQTQITELKREINTSMADRGVLSEHYERTLKIAAWLDFALAYCDEKKDENHCLYSITLEWLFDLVEKSEVDKEALGRELSDILDAFLNHDVASFINYYSSQPKFKQYPVIKTKADLSIVRHYLRLATKLLSGQVPPSGIIPSLGIFIKKPYQFSALLIWAIKQGIAPDALIHSSLLHQFVADHLTDIAQEDNPVAQVFNWLNTFDKDEKIHELVIKAREISCGQQSFEAYSLTGEMQKNDEAVLKTVAHNMPKLVLSLTEGNMADLYRCFGVAFLDQAINLLSTIDTLELQAALHNLLEGSALASARLIELMRYWSQERDLTKQERSFKTLAMIISDGTAKNILAENTAMLLIIPHKPWLAIGITEDTLIPLVQRVIASSETAFEALAQLIVLLKFLNTKNTPLVSLLVDQVLDFVVSSVENTQLVQANDDFLRVLREGASSLPSKELVSEKIKKHQATFIEIIESHTKEPLTADVYGIIKSKQIDNCKKVNLLRSVFQLPEIPYDEYHLRKRVIIYCERQQKHNFNLIQTIKATIKQDQDVNKVNDEIELTCIALLLGALHEGFLIRVIDFLENTLNIANWKDKEYVGKNLLVWAFRQEGLVFLRYLSKDFPKNIALEPAVTAAIISNVKPTINSFIKALIEAGKINELWIRAIIQKDTHLIQSLKELPPKDWPQLLDLLGSDHLKTIINSSQILGATLYKLPVEGWPNILDKIGRSYIQNLPLNNKIFEQIAEFGTADALRASCKLLPSQLLFECDFKETDELIQDRLFEEPVGYNLSLENFIQLKEENLLFRRGLAYLAKRKERMLPLNFAARMKDFNNIIVLLIQFFHDNKDKNPSDAELKTRINNYFNSDEGKEVTAYFNEGHSRTLADIVAPGNDPYQKYRNFLMNINIETLRARFAEFREIIFELAASNEIAPSMAAVVSKIRAVFIVGEVKVKAERNLEFIM